MCAVLVKFLANLLTCCCKRAGTILQAAPQGDKEDFVPAPAANPYADFFKARFPQEAIAFGFEWGGGGRVWAAATVEHCA